MQDMLSPVQDYQPVRFSGEQQDVHMSPSPDNASKDVVSNNPPELSAGPLDEQFVRQPEPTVVASAPQHEGSLKYINKYLVQYVPVKQKKPSSSSRVTGARILTSEECAQIIFEHEEKKRNEKEARRVAREQRKKEKEEPARKKVELAEKRKEEVAKKREEAAKKKEESTKRKQEAARKKGQILRSHKR